MPIRSARTADEGDLAYFVGCEDGGSVVVDCRGGNEVLHRTTANKVIHPRASGGSCG